MKLISFIISIFLLSCSTKQEQKNFNSNTNTIQQGSVRKSIYKLTKNTLCVQTNLSNQFDLYIDFKRFSEINDFQDSCVLNITIKDKITKSILDSFSISPYFLNTFEYLNCDNMTSYVTKFNIDKEVLDNYYGDIVVADFNFDSNDDIAVLSDGGGNNGPIYDFFLQTKDSEFYSDSFLTSKVLFFPSKIDIVSKTLTTYVHIGACILSEHIYKFNQETNDWKESDNKQTNICDK